MRISTLKLATAVDFDRQTKKIVYERKTAKKAFNSTKTENLFIKNDSGCDLVEVTDAKTVYADKQKAIELFTDMVNVLFPEYDEQVKADILHILIVGAENSCFIEREKKEEE